MMSGGSIRMTLPPFSVGATDHLPVQQVGGDRRGKLLFDGNPEQAAGKMAPLDPQLQAKHQPSTTARMMCGYSLQGGESILQQRPLLPDLMQQRWLFAVSCSSTRSPTRQARELPAKVKKSV